MDLYNRQRSKDFTDMFPTSEFLSVMNNRINQELFDKGQLAHGMILYSDLPGVGKTTSARITAVMLNAHLITEEQKNDIYQGKESEVCIEVNSADLRRIDDARVLAQKIMNLRDAMYGYNYVFIFDEAHQLTEDAQNVLMKPIEDCPENVYIFFCTTKMDKIIPTLKSRMEKHKFVPLDMEHAKQLMKDSVRAELSEKDIPADDILETIYREAKGAPRELLVMLSQYLSTGSVDIFIERTEAPLFKEYVEFYERLAKKESISWTTMIMPHVNKILKEHAPEDARIGIITRLAGVVSNLRVSKRVVLDTYTEMYNIFEKPIGYIAKTDFILRSFTLYMWILKNSDSKTAAASSSSSDRSDV